MADTQPAPIDGELKSPPDETVAAASAADSDENEPKAKRSKKSGTVKTREERLEQNRKAARESRKRKKVLVEELQRSVIFFSRGEFSCWCNHLSSTPSCAASNKSLPPDYVQPTEPSAARMRRWNSSSSTPRSSFRLFRVGNNRQCPLPTWPRLSPHPGP